MTIHHSSHQAIEDILTASSRATNQSQGRAFEGYCPTGPELALAVFARFSLMGLAVCSAVGAVTAVLLGVL